MMGDKRASPLAAFSRRLRYGARNPDANTAFTATSIPVTNDLICPSDQTTMAATVWLVDRWRAGELSA